MKYFTNLSTRAKLLFSFGLVLLMFFVVVIVAYSGIQKISKSEKKLYDVNFKIVLNLEELRSHLNFNRAAVLDLILTNEKSEQLAIEKVINERAEIMNALIEKIANFDPDPQFQNRTNKLKNEIEAYHIGREKVVVLALVGKYEEAMQLVRGEQEESYEKIRLFTIGIGEKETKDTENQLAYDMQEADFSLLLFVLVGMTAFLFSIIIVIILNGTIAKPLMSITKIATQIAAGDLKVNVSEDERNDEVGILSKAFRKMIENLRFSLTEMMEGINQLSSSASEILAATTQVASGSAETASAISETTTTVEEVRQASQLTTEKAGRVAESAQRVAQVVQDGQKSVEETVNGMELISNQMESIADTIINLSEQSQSIGGIIALVNDVADQSNLLAVNAGIEAVKAGEHGKGFGVVAQEIKSLAEQSKSATIQVREILTDIQKSTSAAVMVIEKGTKAVEAGMKQSTQTGEAIRVLAGTSKEAVQAATQIVSSNQQQKVGMDQIGSAMENINQASAENSASMRQAEVAAKNLNELGQKLKKLVDQYKL